MLFSIVASLSVASIASGSVLRRAPLNLPKSASNPPDPGMQSIPASAKADNTFSNGAKQLVGLPEDSGETPPAVYGARGTDLPFSRLFHGNMKFFSKGQYNTPDGIRDKWAPEGQDSATQSACGIPDNAWSGAKVAIHPYFLKYADLSRKPPMLMQTEMTNRNEEPGDLRTLSRLLHARCLYLFLERGWLVRHDAQSHRYLQHRSQ